MRRLGLGINWKGVGAALALTLCLGCGPAPKSRFPSPRELIGQLRHQSECSRAVSGEARLTFRDQKGSVSGQVYYVAAAPGSLRFDVVSPFGATLSTLTTNGQDFSLLDVAQGRVFRGAAKACTVARFTRVPLPPEALVETLRGRPATIVHTNEELGWTARAFEPGYYRVRLSDPGGGTQELRIGVHPDDFGRDWSAQRLRYLGTQVWNQGTALYSIQLRGYRQAARKVSAVDPSDPLAPVPLPSGPECSAELPAEIAFEVPGAAYGLTVTNTEVAHNPPLGGDLFSPLLASAPPSWIYCSD